jgi:hypothetical protein
LKTIERSLARAGALIAVLGAAAAVLPATALAVTPPLTIAVTGSGYSTGTGSSAVYFDNVGVTYGITYTLKDNSTANTATTGTTFTGVGFTDALPAGVTLDDEVGETAKNCGVPFTPSNQPGASTVTESGLTIVNGSTCTITLEFVPATAEVAAPDAISGATYTYTPSGGSAITYTQTANPTDFGITLLALTVAPLPTLSVSGVTNNASYTYGQAVDLDFSATAATDDAIPAGDVYATDDQGNTLASGAAINTQVPGSHQVDVWVTTQDGYLGSQTYTYTVASPALKSVKAAKSGNVSFNVEYLAPGSVLAEVLDGKTVIGKVTKKVTVGTETAITVKPTAAGKKLLAKLTTIKKIKVKGKIVKKKTTKSIKATLSVLYTASNFSYIGNQPTITKSGIKLT